MKKLVDLFYRLSLPIVSFYIRLFKYSPGRWRIIKNYLPWLRNNGKFLGTKLIISRYGFKFNVDLGDWLGQYIYLTGDYEPPTSRIIERILTPGDTFIDIGANAGFFTLLASLKVGLSGQVFSFEPIPFIRKGLLDNIHMNQYDNVKVFDLALSNTAGTISIYEGPEGHKGISSITPIENPSQILTVKTATLDSMLNDFPKVHLIKLDVEGAEKLVLEGAQELIERDKPQFIIEVTDSYLMKLGSNANDLCRMLTDKGYKMFAIEEDNLRPILQLPGDWTKQFNALFTPN